METYDPLIGLSRVYMIRGVAQDTILVWVTSTIRNATNGQIAYGPVFIYNTEERA